VETPNVTLTLKNIVKRTQLAEMAGLMMKNIQNGAVSQKGDRISAEIGRIDGLYRRLPSMIADDNRL
jgi:hypothetical protein